MSFSLNVSTVLSAIQGGSLLSVLNSALSVSVQREPY